MVSILDRIIARKRSEVEARKQHIPIPQLEQRSLFTHEPVSLSEALREPDAPGIIAEFKRRSPSRGPINSLAGATYTTTAYAAAGATGLSVLTDFEFFGGSEEDFMACRQVNKIPMLRKEFIIDEYQVIESKSLGADVILLIAAVLDGAELKKLTSWAHALGMEVLIEVHQPSELKASLDAGPDLIGVNNRDLRNFSLSVDISRRLASQIPPEIVKISESGIESPAVIQELRGLGYKGFLIGQTFMQEKDPGKAAADFINRIRNKK